MSIATYVILHQVRVEKLEATMNNLDNMKEKNLNQFGCACCMRSNPEETYRGVLDNTNITNRLFDETHFKIYTRQCEKCYQIYLVVFTEIISWHDGNDPQRRCILSVSHSEVGVLLKLTDEYKLIETIEKLTSDRPSLCMSYIGDDECFFIAKGILYWSHD